MEKPRLQQKYEKEIAKALVEQLGLKNVMAVPKLKKVVLNIGLKPALKDAKFIDAAERTLIRISGQKPVKTVAKKSISNFKIRENMVVGMMVTLRGARMYDFLDKLVTITMPRIRDFRGISTKIIDHAGNMSIGFKDFLAFPEIRSEDTDYIHGLELTAVTNAKSRKNGEALFRALGVPFNDTLKK